MGYKDASSKERFVILTNAAFRVAQFVVALVTIGVFAVVKANWQTDVPGRFAFDVAVGVTALIISFIFGIIPFQFSYRPVASGAVLDFVMAALYGVAFGLVKAPYDSMRHWNGGDLPHPYIYPAPTSDDGKIVEEWMAFHRNMYVNIAGLILFLASGFMGATLIFVSCKTAGRIFKF